MTEEGPYRCTRPPVTGKPIPDRDLQRWINSEWEKGWELITYAGLPYRATAGFGYDDVSKVVDKIDAVWVFKKRSSVETTGLAG